MVAPDTKNMTTIHVSRLFSTLLTIARRPAPTGLDSRKPLTTFFPAASEVGDGERFATGTGTSRAAEEHDGLRVWWREGPGLDPIDENESCASERLCGRDTAAETCGNFCRRIVYVSLASVGCDTRPCLCPDFVSN